MSEMPGEPQTGTNQHDEKPVRSVKAKRRTPGSRSLKAGGAFLKALASDLGAVTARLRRLLSAQHRRTRLPRGSAPRRISWGSVFGRAFRFVSIALFGLASVGALALVGFALFLVYGVPEEPRRSDGDALRAQFEARKGEPLGHIGPLKPGESSKTGVASRQDVGREPAAQAQAGADVKAPSEVKVPAIAFLGNAGSSAADAAEQTTATKEKPTEPGAGVDQPQLAPTEPQDSRAASPQQEISRTLAGSPPRMQCSVDLCAKTYKSFNAGDCTYQPYGSGRRALCELSSGAADARPQAPQTVTDARSQTKETRVAPWLEELPKSAAPPRTGAQCNTDLCAKTYASFHAADCTYQPLGGGPRLICEQSSGSSDLPRQTSREATEPTSEAKDTRDVERAPEIPKLAPPVRAGAQCNVELCAKTYASFHAADCTYQPHGGGPRSLCER